MFLVVMIINPTPMARRSFLDLFRMTTPLHVIRVNS